MISERVTSGMRNAAAKGKVIGRLHTTVADIPQRFMKSYPLYEKHKINQSELARITGLNRGTVRKYIKMLEEIKTKYWEIRIFIGNNIKSKYDKYLYDRQSYRPHAI